jgi:hypothetical protein
VASTQLYLDGKWADEKYGYQWWINPAGFYSAVIPFIKWFGVL